MPPSVLVQPCEPSVHGCGVGAGVGARVGARMGAGVGARVGARVGAGAVPPSHAHRSHSLEQPAHRKPHACDEERNAPPSSEQLSSETRRPPPEHAVASAVPMTPQLLLQYLPHAQWQGALVTRRHSRWQPRPSQPQLVDPRWK